MYQDIFQLVYKNKKKCHNEVSQTYKIDISLTGDNDKFNVHKGTAATPWGIWHFAPGPM